MCKRTPTKFTCGHTVSRVAVPCSEPHPGCDTTTPPEPSPAVALTSSEDCPTCKELKDDEASILAELEAAIASNPALKAENPGSTEPQWEDYEEALAKNPDFAAPVATSNREKKYYFLKEKWECGHEGTPYQTAIERDSGDDNDEDALLISDIKGICPACMEKWTKLEEGVQDAAGGSSGPPGLPSYSQSWETDHAKDHAKLPGPGDLPDDVGPPSSRSIFGRETNLGDHDESPAKGKAPVNAPASAPGQTPRSPTPFSDDGESITSSGTLSDSPGPGSGKPKKKVRIYESDDSEYGNTGKAKPKSKNTLGASDSEDDYDSDDGSLTGSEASADEKVNKKKKGLSFFKRGSK